MVPIAPVQQFLSENGAQVFQTVLLQQARIRTMYVKRLLAINMASFAALGTVLLGLGEENPVLAIVAVVAAMAAVWITDVLGIFRLNRRVTNVAVLLAVLRSLWELLRIQGSDQVIAISNLLAYVMIILLFQEKDFRTWWHIALLSILQVAASATFFQGVWFAPLLLLYFFLGMSAMALLFLHHERTHYHQVQHRPILPRETRTVSDRLGVNWRRLAKMAMATFVVGPVSLFLDYGETDDKTRVRGRRRPQDPGRGRWHLIHEEPEFTGSADNLGGRAGVGFEFYRQLGRLIPGTLFVAIVLFLLIPRLGRFNFALPRFGSLSFGDTHSTPLRSVGFSDTVELGELGMLIEDPEEVMRVQFLDPYAEAVYPVQGEIYLRGALLSDYRHGRWVFSGSGYVPGYRGAREQSVYPQESEFGPGLVWQRILIQPLDRRELFCIWPFVAVERNDRLMRDMESERLRRRGRRTGQMMYHLGTYALVDGEQVPLTPSPMPIRPDYLLDVPEEDLPTLIERAKQWIAESELDESQVAKRARYLESKLKDSPQYAYSLEGQARDTELDPIEDFMKNTPLGHCEYFATALTLMLRSQGIQARMVIGFVSNEYDLSGEHFRVRQRDAHTWVEAYIPPDLLPEVRPFGRPETDWSGGGWLRLDPTPSSTANPGAFNSLVDNVGSWIGWVKSAWVKYVVQMDSNRQQAAVYDPLRKMAAQLRNKLGHVEGWRDLWRWMISLPRHLQALLADAGWFSWVGGGLLLGALGFGYGVYRLLRWMVVLLARLLPQGSGGTSRKSRVAFYRRLETLLARRGLRREPGQTQREFAVAAGEKLSASQSNGAADATLTVTDAFYRVRFGSAQLDRDRVKRVEQALHQLEQATR